MIRSSIIFAAVLALLAPQAHADEDRNAPRLFGLILTLTSWPPDTETAALIRRKLEEAGLEETDMIERFRSWFFRPEESKGPSISEICADLTADERTRTLIESCRPDQPLSIPAK